MPVGVTGGANPAVDKAAQELIQKLTGIESKIGEVDALTKSVDELKNKLKGFDGFDPKKLNSDVEEIKSGYDGIKKAIRTSKSAGYIPGIEDEGKNFSLVRAAVATVTNDWSKAGFEKEVIKQARDAATKAGHVIGIDSSAGNFVPDQVIPDVIAAIYVRSVFVDLAGDGQTRVSVLDGLTGIPVKIPKFNGGMLAYWIGEQDKYTESFVSTGNVSMSPRKLGVLTRVTDEMQRFTGYGFENLMRNDMTRAAAKLLDYTIPYGKGTENMPRGIINMPGVNWYSAEQGDVYDPTVITDSQGAELDFDGLDEMSGVLEDLSISSDGAGYISAPRYFRRLKRTRVPYFPGQTNGGYLLGGPMLPDAALDSLLGDWDETVQVPTNNKPGGTPAWATTSTEAKFGDVFYGVWREIILGRWAGVEILNDNGQGQGFISDQTYVKFRTYVDVGHRQEKAIVVCPDARMRT